MERVIRITDHHSDDILIGGVDRVEAVFDAKISLVQAKVVTDDQALLNTVVGATLVEHFGLTLSNPQFRARAMSDIKRTAITQRRPDGVVGGRREHLRHFGHGLER